MSKVLNFVLKNLSSEQKIRIENNFTYHPPFGDLHEKYAFIRSQSKELAFILCELVPESRELSLALTKLEEAVMWANAGIARNELPGDVIEPTTDIKEEK